jgi:TatA/E family protein of Tat protein translocase
VVLLVFGPEKLPEFAKLLGKTIREFRSTVDEAKTAIENEIYKEGMGAGLKDIGKDVKDALNIYEEIDKPVRGMARDLKEALNLDGAAAPSAGEIKKGKDDEKGE